MESHKIHIPNHQPDEYEHIYIYIYNMIEQKTYTQTMIYTKRHHGGGCPLANQKPSMYGKVLNI